LLFGCYEFAFCGRPLKEPLGQTGGRGKGDCTLREHSSSSRFRKISFGGCFSAVCPDLQVYSRTRMRPSSKGISIPLFVRDIESSTGSTTRGIRQIPTRMESTNDRSGWPRRSGWTTAPSWSSNPPDRACQQKMLPLPNNPWQGGVENYAHGKCKPQGNLPIPPHSCANRDFSCQNTAHWCTETPLPLAFHSFHLKPPNSSRTP
jgi:hypothetical protein